MIFGVAVEAARASRPRNALVGAMPQGMPPPTAALHEAAARGHVGCVQALLDGAHTNALLSCALQHRPAPSVAALCLDTSVLPFLLQLGRPLRWHARYLQRRR